MYLVVKQFEIIEDERLSFTEFLKGVRVISLNVIVSIAIHFSQATKVRYSVRFWDDGDEK